jgi:hypothetical protein
MARSKWAAGNALLCKLLTDLRGWHLVFRVHTSPFLPHVLTVFFPSRSVLPSHSQPCPRVCVAWGVWLRPCHHPAGPFGVGRAGRVSTGILRTCPRAHMMECSCTLCRLAAVVDNVGLSGGRQCLVELTSRRAHPPLQPPPPPHTHTSTLSHPSRAPASYSGDS